MHRFFYGLFLSLLILTQPASGQERPDGVAVIIGNRDYKGTVPRVDYAHNDAEAIKRWIIEVQGFRPGNIIDLRNASQAEMLSVLGSTESHRGRLFQYVRPGESEVIVFYSGHGMPGLRDRRGYLLPVDGNPDTVEINGYPIDTLFANLGKLEAKSILVMLDACFSGESQKGTLVRGASGLVIEPRMPASQARLTVITAAKGDQVASWDESASHGLFTEYLLRGLYGAADKERGNKDGRVSVGELKAYLDREMTYAARRAYNRDQNATVQGDEALVLAAVRPGQPRPVLAPAPVSAPPPSSDIALDPIDKEMVTTGATRIRATPSVSAPVALTLPAGAKVLVVGRIKGSEWYAIERDGKMIGYGAASAFEDPRAAERRRQEAKPAAPPPPPPVVVVQPTPTDPETALWYSVRDSRDAQAIRRYIRQYPTGRYNEEAWQRLRDLN